MMKGLEKVSQVLGHTQNIHSTSKYFVNEAKNVKMKNPYRAGLDFTFEGPTAAKVNEPVVFYGTAPAGMVKVFSANKSERKLYAKNGKYYVSLFFSRPGTYDMYAESQNQESKHLSVRVD